MNSRKKHPILKADVVEKFRKDYHLNLCLECGKCSAVCPMVDLYGGYDYGRSSRAVVERMLFEPERIEGEALWYCLTCAECSFYCPSGVLFQDFMSALRGFLLQQGQTEFAVFCPTCGAYLMPAKELEHLAALENRAAVRELLASCSRCKRKKVLDAVHRIAR